MQRVSEAPLARFINDGHKPPDALLPELLRSIRSHLSMEVAFISEFTEGRRVFRFVESASAACPVQVGGSDPLEQSFCQRVVDGRLPELIRDALEVPAALELPVTRALPVGAHMSVPIRLADGSIYGTFCAFSARPDQTLGPRDLAVMRVFADLAAQSIERGLEGTRRRAEATERVRSAMKPDGLLSVYQPIVDLQTGSVSGFESLTRFLGEPKRGPDVWFAEAAALGLGVDLELHAAKRGLRALSCLPETVYVAINLSPAALLDRRLHALLAEWPARRIVVEVTEHDIVKEYEALTNALEPLRESGAKVAVDDAGAGYASFRHILRLRPDYIKLDISLTRGIDQDPGAARVGCRHHQFWQRDRNHGDRRRG
jgi:EAL domain-containing protein (putative c-di-GMP-specific phosphodiesterase class I)